METISVVLEKDLLQAANRAAKRCGVNRSALIREALREHLKRLQIRELEAQDRRGYEKHPAAPAEATVWERVASWPDT